MAENFRPFGLSVHKEHLNNEYFAACREAGVYSVEISLSPSQYPTLDWNELAAMIHGNGLVINSVHLPFSGDVNIANLDPAKRAATMELDRSVMKAAAAHGTKIAVLHPSSEPISNADRPLAMQYSKENLRLLADYAEELGMIIAVEDLPRTCLGRNGAEMRELLSADPRLRACFDTNHLLSEPIADCVRAIGDKIVTLHVSDYDFIDERHLLPGELDIDWAEFMDLLDEIGYRGVFNYEVSGGAETRYITRAAALTPEDYRKNYESLCRREKPCIPEGKIIYPRFPKGPCHMRETIRPYGVYVNSKRLNPSYLAACKAAGMYSVELSLRPDEYRQLDWDSAAQMILGSGLRIHSVHMPFSETYNIAHFDPEIRKNVMELHRQVLEQASRFGTKIAVIHPASSVSDERRKEALQISKESLRTLTEWAEELGMTAAVENLPHSLGAVYAELLELLTAHPKLRACLDVNHLITEPVADYIRAVGKHIAAIHVSDCDFVNERHLLPGELDIDWEEYMDLLDEIDFRGVFTYEVSGDAVLETIRREADLTPEDFRKNYASLCRREKPCIPPGKILYR